MVLKRPESEKNREKLKMFFLNHLASLKNIRESEKKFPGIRVYDV